MSLKIDMDLSDFENLSEKMDDSPTWLQMEVHEALEIASKFIEVSAKEKVGVKSGFLRSTTYAMYDPHGMEIKVGAWADYAKFHEFDTRPHIIRAVHARALRFEIGNKIVFAKWVFHPGTKGTHFLSRAIQENMPRVKEVVRRALILFGERLKNG